MAYSSAEKYTVHVEPRISANQLAEYALASPSRRHAIVRNAKFAPTYLVIRYKHAKQAICNFLSDGTRNTAILHKAELAQKNAASSASSEFAKNDALLSAEAIASFAATQDMKLLSKLTFTPVNNPLPKLQISGVNVSVKLDLISHNAANEKLGGLILQTSKAVSSKNWRDEHGAVVASLCWMQAQAHFVEPSRVDRKLCFSVDVFAKKIGQAPASYKKRLKDIEASCAEISMLWHVIPPPNDFDGDF